jgi:hypothetical protein
MMRSPLTAVLALALIAVCPTASAAVVQVANADFETPIYADAAFATGVSTAQQGGYGWSFSASSGIFNPPAVDYTGAGGTGTLAGASGAQVGWIAGTLGDYDLYQRLAGPDGIVGNGNDPVLEAFTIYTLTVAVGQRAVGNLYGGTEGGYDIQLRAGADVFTASIVASEVDAVTLQPGNFVERTIVWDSALADLDDLGLPLTILFALTKPGSTAATEFDGVRLDATYVAPTADFDKNNIVDNADLGIWKAGFGLSGAVMPMQGDVDRNLQIDGTDFLHWQRRLGGPSAVAAPEPSAGVLLAGMAVLMGVRRGRLGD